MTDYEKFLSTKVKTRNDGGFIAETLNPNLFPFQDFIVKRALKAGKYAIFADCGLGKTLMQLSWAEEVAKHTGGRVLILAPLAVRGQTIAEGERFGIDMSGIDVQNYEQIDNIDCHKYAGIVLDESSILKNFTGVYKRKIIENFGSTTYKLACTATPAPNDLNEIGNHSEFLDVMDSADMRMRWFVRDEEMNNYRLKGHAESDFYGWISSWSSVLRSPSDLGFDSRGYDLPALHFETLEITTGKKDNGKLFNDSSVNATEFNRELRVTLAPRIDAVAEIVNASSEQFIIWVNQNEEEERVCELIPDAVAVRGSDSPEKRNND